jgi:hypothetical protein
MSTKSIVQALLHANPFAHRTHAKPMPPEHLRFVRRHIDGVPTPAHESAPTQLDEPSIPSLPIG